MSAQTQPIKHGTNWGYTGRKCKCKYCSAANRVYQKGNRSKEDVSALMDAVREAALSGGPIPLAAAGRAPERMRVRSDEEVSATRGEVLAATEKAHEARLRAVEHAEGDPMRLALLAVAEYTDDPIRALRYARVAEALA